MQGLIRTPLLLSTAAKVPLHTSEATVKVMSGADAVCIAGGGGRDARPVHVRRGTHSPLPPR